MKKVNESKIDNYIERMQQPLISDKVEEEFKNTKFKNTMNY